VPNEVMIKIRVKDETDYEPTLQKARDFGAKVKEVLDESGTIGIKIDDEEAKVKLKEFEEELHKLNGEDAKVKIKVDGDEAKLGVEEVADDLEKEIGKEGGKSGSSWGKSFTDSLKNFDFKPGLMPVGLAIGAAFAPLLGASIAGLIVGGLGLGGIVGGVLVATRDARVKTAFTGMKKDLGDSLKIDAAPFVPVVISALGQIQRTVKDIDLAGIFKDLAPQVQPVLAGILSLVSSLGSALKNVAANSGPVLAELGTDFRNLGRTLEAAFNSLDDNSKQEATALHDLFAVIDGSITIVFGLVNAFTELYDVYHKLVIDTSPIGWYEKVQDSSQNVTSAVNDQVSAVLAAIDANHSLGRSMESAAQDAKDQTKAIKGVSDALKAATDPAFALIDAQKQVNDAQNAYNKAVKTGGKNSADARGASLDLQKAYINLVGAMSDARGGSDHLSDAQVRMLKTAGASDSVIRQLNSSLKAAYASAHRLDGYDVTLSVTYKRTFETFGKPFSTLSPNPTTLAHGLAHGGVSGAANGATSSGLTWVGETGPELLDLPPGTGVQTAGDSQRTAAKMGGGGGDGSTMHVNFMLDGKVLAAALVDPQRKIVRQLYGGSVQAAYGAGA
jgi:hypothetical protein